MLHTSTYHIPQDDEVLHAATRHKGSVWVEGNRGHSSVVFGEQKELLVVNFLRGLSQIEHSDVAVLESNGEVSVEGVLEQFDARDVAFLLAVEFPDNFSCFQVYDESELGTPENQTVHGLDERRSAVVTVGQAKQDRKSTRLNSSHSQ